MAVAYATIANGGHVLTPRLGLRIEDSSGRVQQQLQAPAARTVNVQPGFRQAILDGLKSGKSVGQTLQSLGLSEKEAKEAEATAKREAKEAEHDADKAEKTGGQ